MHKFDITLSQRLDDGDCALLEEHKDVDGYYIADLINEYHNRAVSHSYVKSYTVIVTIK